MYHKLLKHGPRYDLQNKMSWYSDFKSFTEKLFPLQLREEKPQILDSKIEAKQN